MDKNYEELANQFLDMSKPKDVEYIIINAGGTVFIYYKDEGAPDLIQSGSPPDLIRYGENPESCDAVPQGAGREGGLDLYTEQPEVYRCVREEVST